MLWELVSVGYCLQLNTTMCFGSSRRLPGHWNALTGARKRFRIAVITISFLGLPTKIKVAWGFFFKVLTVLPLTHCCSLMDSHRPPRCRPSLSCCFWPRLLITVQISLTTKGAKPNSNVQTHSWMKLSWVQSICKLGLVHCHEYRVRRKAFVECYVNRKTEHDHYRATHSVHVHDNVNNI